MKKKLIVFCIALGLSLTLAAPSFAVVTLNVDADSQTTGVYTSGSPLIIPTLFGNIEFVGEIRDPDSDPEFTAAGASGKVFDVDWPSRTAELTFKFNPKYEIRDITFIYGGNADFITVEALDSSATVLDSLVNAPTYDGYPAGPVTLYAGFGNSIYSLKWEDPADGGPFRYEFAALDNISLTVIPAPGAILLSSIGVGLVGWLRKRKTL